MLVSIPSDILRMGNGRKINRIQHTLDANTHTHFYGLFDMRHNIIMVVDSIHDCDIS